MSSSAAVLRFAAEFATFLVAVAGAVIVLLRPRLLGVDRYWRVALLMGFFAVAVAAFLHGSFLYDAEDLPVLVLRSVGIVLLGIGTLGWGQDRATRRVVWVALVLFAAAEAAVAAGVASGVVDTARVFGAIGLGAVLFSSARRSIPARVAVSTAACLLLVVLAVSVALSVVISDNVEKEALRLVDNRARAEAGEVRTSDIPTATTNATLVAATLQGGRLTLLEDLDQDPRPSDVLASDIQSFVDANLLRGDHPLVYATAEHVLVLFRGIDRAGAEALVGSTPVEEAVTGQGRTGSVQVVGDRALAVGAAAVTAPAPEGRRAVGVLVATTALDDAYLNQRAVNDESVSLAVVDRNSVLSEFGPLPETGVVEVGRAALESNSGSASSVTDGYFLAASVVRAYDNSAVLAMVAATPTTVVDDTRNSLFRTLFLVGLGTALLAFLAASFVGERIGGGLRRLTVAAEGVQRGDFTTRVAVTSQDELGVLASTLNSMAGSIETLTTELREKGDAEARLRGRLEAVVAGMGEAVVAVDQEGRITTFNEAAEDLFGVAAGQAEGRPVSQVVRVVDDDGRDLTPRLSPPEEGRWATAAVVRRDDGVDVPVALSAGGLAGPDGGVGGGVWVLRDMRREREAERTKTDLLANISHELRTPLVPIKGYAMMLGQGRLRKEEARSALEAIEDAADQLERVVGRLLEVAGGGGGGGDEPAGRAPAQVRSVVDSLVQRWKARLGDSRPITRRTARNLPELVVDRRRLDESLDELMDNAVKFSPPDSRILVTARLVEDFVPYVPSPDGSSGPAEPGPAVEIAVDDLGIGIAEDELGRIFDDFGQADSTATRSFGGLGLGLSVVRRTVEAHGGELVCDTEEGRGSRFSIILPVVPIDAGETG